MGENTGDVTLTFALEIVRNCGSTIVPIFFSCSVLFAAHKAFNSFLCNKKTAQWNAN